MSTNMQHYYWAGGHGLMFVTGMRYLLAWVLFKSTGLGYWYKGTSLIFWLQCILCVGGLVVVRCVRLTEIASIAAAFTGAFLSYLIVVKWVFYFCTCWFYAFQAFWKALPLPNLVLLIDRMFADRAFFWPFYLENHLGWVCFSTFSSNVYSTEHDVFRAVDA